MGHWSARRCAEKPSLIRDGGLSISRLLILGGIALTYSCTLCQPPAPPPPSPPPPPPQACPAQPPFIDLATYVKNISIPGSCGQIVDDVQLWNSPGGLR